MRQHDQPHTDVKSVNFPARVTSGSSNERRWQRTLTCALHMDNMRPYSLRCPCLLKHLAESSLTASTPPQRYFVRPITTKPGSRQIRVNVHLYFLEGKSSWSRQIKVNVYSYFLESKSSIEKRACQGGRSNCLKSLSRHLLIRRGYKKALPARIHGHKVDILGNSRYDWHNEIRLSFT